MLSQLHVLGPSGVPVVTDARVAQQNPELAVLSAMAHGRDANVTRAIDIAAAAQRAASGLDLDRSRIYLDLIMNSLGEAARRALTDMDPRKYVFQSDFARRYIALGRAEGIEEGRSEGRTEGRAALILRQLANRFGSLDPVAQANIRRASVAELEVIGDRLLTAGSLEEALGSRPGA